jgi:hypothetical protein
MNNYISVNIFFAFSMSEIIENAWVVICLVTPAFQSSNECLRQLSYAQSHNKPIIPIIAESNWSPTGGLKYSISNIQSLKWGSVQPSDVAPKMSELFLRLRTLFTGKKPDPKELRGARRTAAVPEREMAALQVMPRLSNPSPQPSQHRSTWTLHAKRS